MPCGLPEYIYIWDIHGQTSKLIGDKFLDSDFINKLHESHIVGLVELHTEMNQAYLDSV